MHYDGEWRLERVFVCVNARATTNRLNLHILDYLHRYGYVNAAHGLEQDVPELSHRPSLPLNNNLLVDYWPAIFDNYQARALKAGPPMNPKYMDVRSLISS